MTTIRKSSKDCEGRMEKKLCPFTKKYCFEKDCAMWVQLPDDSGVCSFRHLSTELFVIADVLIKANGFDLEQANMSIGKNQ